MSTSFAGVAQRIARRAHNPEVTRSKRVAGILTLHLLYRSRSSIASDAKQATIHRCGAEVARGADNPEVTGSKPVAGILSLRPFKEAGKHISPV